MGSFRGHALPGTIFILISTWWTLNISRRYFKNRSNMNLYRNELSYTITIRRREIPIEGIMKILGASLDIVGELAAVVQNIKDQKETDLVDIQHATISSFFLIHGVFDILMSKKCLKIPLSMDYITLVMAFTVEALMFYFHVAYGREMLDKTMHQLLLISIIGCMVSVGLEYIYPQSLLFGFCRIFFTFLQGVWFFEIAFVLYPQFSWQRDWLQKESDISIFAATMFAWSMAIVLVIMTIIHCVTYCFLTNLLKCNCNTKDTGSTFKSDNDALIQGDTNGGHYELLDNQADELESVLEINTKTDY